MHTVYRKLSFSIRMEGDMLDSLDFYVSIRGAVLTDSVSRVYEYLLNSFI